MRHTNQSQWDLRWANSTSLTPPWWAVGEGLSRNSFMASSKVSPCKVQSSKSFRCVTSQKQLPITAYFLFIRFGCTSKQLYTPTLSPWQQQETLLDDNATVQQALFRALVRRVVFPMQSGLYWTHVRTITYFEVVFKSRVAIPIHWISLNWKWEALHQHNTVQGTVKSLLPPSLSTSKASQSLSDHIL